MNAPTAKVIVERTPEAAAEQAANRMAGLISERVATGNDCFVALSGGTTPGETYRHLAGPPHAEQVPWQRVHVFFGDERDVPQDDVENNYRLVSKLLLDQVPVALPKIHPMPADCRDLAAAAEQYASLVRRAVPSETIDGVELPCFDVILLGIGADGHTASLFPDTPALAERKKLIVAQYVPVIGRNRMTFTFPLINAARHVIFLVTGADKADVIARVLSDDPAVRSQLPAGRVQPRSGALTFILDAEAARHASVPA